MTACVRPANRKPSLRQAVRWIAHNDNAGGGDNPAEIAGYISTGFAADLFNCGQYEVAKRVAAERRRAGLTVGSMTTKEQEAFSKAVELGF